MNLLDEPHGGSLNTTVFRGDEVIKHYGGPLARGHGKLRAEWAYLLALPESVADRFAVPIEYRERYDPTRETTLILRRHPDPAVAKALLVGGLTPDRTAAIVQELARTLTEDLYPLTRVPMSGADVYFQYHAARLRVVDDLAAMPALTALCEADAVIVNGVRCPGLRQVVAWLRSDAPRLFRASRVCVRAHLDTHLDNVLASTAGPLRLVLVDPRGEMHGPPHYDWAKSAKSLRGLYHQIHYGQFESSIETDGGVCTVRLEVPVSGEVAAACDAGLRALIAAAPAYAEAESLSVEDFAVSALVAELVHYISFAYYHANRPEGMDESRVRAYLAIASVLAHRLMSGTRDLDSLREPLLKGA